MKQKILIALVAVLVATLTALALFWHPQLPERENSAATPRGGDFTLQSADGPVSLHDFRGRLVLVYFGYTYCPDVCPTALSTVSDALHQLTSAELARVAVIFVSIDPARDTPERLKEYARFFHPAMLGVTGDEKILAEIAGRYGVFYARQPAPTSGGGYAVDHTSDVFVVGPDGRLLGKIAHGTASTVVAGQIRQYLNSN